MCRTNKEVNAKVFKSCYADPRHKKLVPYSPNASRNRPKDAVSSMPDVLLLAYVEILGSLLAFGTCDSRSSSA
jgi:hypothetical protein